MTTQLVPRSDLPVMLANERAILTILKTHRGSASAITAREIGGEIGITAREVRRLIRRLCVTFGRPICASPANPKGYFIAANARELTAHVDRLMRHARIEIIHAVRLQPNRHARLIGQLTIDLSREPAQ